MPRLAIVVSAIGSVESLEGTLVSVLEHRPADCEILVALDRPYADPYGLQGEVRFVSGPRGASPVACTNEAVRLSRSPFVHLLASGCEATEGWTDGVLERFGDRRVGSVVPLALAMDRRDRVFAAGIGYRRSGQRYLVGHAASQWTREDLAQAIGPAGFAAFYRKAAWERVGGFCHQLGPQMADADLALSLRAAGYTVAFEEPCKVYVARDVEASTSALRDGLAAERLFWRNLPADGRGGSVATHALLVGGELLGSILRPRRLARVAARGWACLEFGGYARRRRQLALWKQSAQDSSRPNGQLRVDGKHAASAPEAPTSRVRAR